jgi:hypothetical protein
LSFVKIKRGIFSRSNKKKATRTEIHNQEPEKIAWVRSRVFPGGWMRASHTLEDGERAVYGPTPAVWLRPRKNEFMI